MEAFLNIFQNPGPAGADVFSMAHVAWALLSSFLLCLGLALTYRATHRGLSYSVSYVHSLVILGVTTAVIMLIIGSNIARAFSLVGALSIIRFRNAVKETRDVGFLFVAMAIGMSAGTGFILLGMVFTVFICGVIWFLHAFEVGAHAAREVLLTIQVPDGTDPRVAFGSVFSEQLEDQTLIGMESVRGGALLELSYSVRLKPNATEQGLLSAIREKNGQNKVALILGRDLADY